MARIYGSTNNSNWGLFVDLWEDSYSVENNTSRVIAKVYLYRPNSASYYGGTANISVTVNGERKSTSYYPSYPTNISAGEGNAHCTATFEYTVPHNNDGSKSTSMSMSWSADFNPTSGSGSGSLTLTTIPRASEVTATDTYIESSTSININKKNDSFTSTLRYEFGSKSGILCEKISQTNYGWVIPIEFYEEVKDRLHKTCTLYCDTYNGNTLIGTKSTTFDIAVNEVTNAPVLDARVIDNGSITTKLTGNENIFIKNKSNIKAIWTATGVNGATISRQGVRVGSGADLVTTSPYTTVWVEKIVVWAVDSRGIRTEKEFSEAKGTMNIIDYKNLTISTKAYRIVPTGDEVKIEYSGNIWVGNFQSGVSNTLKMQYEKREQGQEWGSTVYPITDFVIDTTNNTFSGELTLSGYDYKKAYEFRIYAFDGAKVNDVTYSLTTAGGQVMVVTQGIPTFDVGKDDMSVNVDLDVKGSITNNGRLIIESGTNDNGSWIRFSDGTLICYGRRAFSNVNITTVWGSVYETATKYDFGNFPHQFIDTPILSMEQIDGTTVYRETIGGTGRSNLGSTWFNSPVQKSGASFVFGYIAIGRWK